MTSSRKAGAFFAKTGLLGATGMIGLAAVAALALGAPGNTVEAGGKTARFEDAVEHRFPVPHGGAVMIDGLAGTVAMTAWDSPEVRVRIERRVEMPTRSTVWPWERRTTPFADEAEQTAYLDEFDLAAAADAYGLRLTAVQPVRRIGVVVSARYEIHVPANTPVTVRSNQGAIECDGVSGPLRVQTAVGEIRLLGVTGPVSAETSAGGIHVALARDARAENDIVCRTLDGPVRVALPADSGFTLEVDALSGRFVSEFPITVNAPHNGQRFTAISGNGAGRIAIDTLDGDITLTAL